MGGGRGQGGGVCSRCFCVPVLITAIDDESISRFNKLLRQDLAGVLLPIMIGRSLGLGIFLGCTLLYISTPGSKIDVMFFFFYQCTCLS